MFDAFVVILCFILVCFGRWFGLVGIAIVNWLVMVVSGDLWWFGVGFVVSRILGVLVELFGVTLECWLLANCFVCDCGLLLIYAFVVGLRLCRVGVELSAGVLWVYGVLCLVLQR